MLYGRNGIAVPMARKSRTRERDVKAGATVVPLGIGGLFKCKRCGACCRLSELPKEQITKDEYGIFYAIRQGSNVFEIWPWEAERLRAAAEEKETRLSIKPCMFIVDKKELGRVIVLTYYIGHKECPFVSEKTCTVHDRRPRTCRMFPIFGHRTGIGISQMCPFLVPLELTTDEASNGLLIQASYRDEVEHVFKDMEVYKSVFGLVRDMDANGVIQWDKDASGQVAAKLMKERGVDLLDLIRYEGVLSEDELRKAIERLESMEGIRENLELRIRRGNLMM